VTFRRAISLSLRVHLLLLLLLWQVDLRSTRARVTEERKTAARKHETVLQRNASETYADRLKRMREILDRLHDQEKEKPAEAKPTETSKPMLEPASEPAPKTPQPVDQLWKDSRDQYQALRARFLEEKARTLVELTKMNPADARKEMEARYQNAAPEDAAAPSSTGKAAEDIARMHNDAQRMLAEMVERSRAKGQGQGLRQGQGSARELQLLTQNGPDSVEARQFDEVVDYTPLMLSKVARVNSELDTPEDTRRIAMAHRWDLQNRYNKTIKQVQFTRRIGGEGARLAPWIAPDAWYIIGPFPNRWRSQIETSFPPELEIDRDATYEGRDGRPISWQYVRTPRVGIIPPDMVDFAVYYAYTEINCATPLDCWLAIGSDDYSKVWLNGLLIWSGSKNEKIWSATEGFRRVHLQQGVNKILYRLENGINGCEFSLVIALE
jgi:hypothetical protein